MADTNTTAAQEAEPAPIDMVLHCPACGMQHIDAPETLPMAYAIGAAHFSPGYEPWENPPHRSHLCHGCSHIWRPADVPTNGVAAVQTKGKADSPIAALAPRPQADAGAPPAVPEGWRLVPVEPTSEMLAALSQEWHASRHRPDRYAAMLAAAPAPAAPDTAAAVLSLAISDIDTCVGEVGRDYEFKELSTETLEALAAYRAAAPRAPAAPTAAAAEQAPAPAEAVERIVHLRADRDRRIYVAGPMTGLPEYNFPAFNAAAQELRDAGWHVENPAEHGHVEGAGWADYLRWDISRIATCGAVYLLPGWPASKGARLEVHIAKTLGLRIVLADGAEDATAQAPAAGAVPIGTITQPYTVAEIRERVASGDYSAELMLQHALLHLGAGAAPTDAMVDAYMVAQRRAVEEADQLGRANIGGLHTNAVREACRAGLAAALGAAAPAQEAEDEKGGAHG